MESRLRTKLIVLQLFLPTHEDKIGPLDSKNPAAIPPEAKAAVAVEGEFVGW